MGLFNKKKKEEEKKDPMFSPRTKGLAFFAFYGFFFAFFIMYTGSLSSQVEEQEDKVEIPSYSIEQINEGNHKYKYTLIEDNITTIIEGERNLAKQQYTKSSNEIVETYFDNNGTILIKSEEWELYQEQPIPYVEFTDIKTINQLIKNSTFIAKTEFANQEETLEYHISTTTLVEILEDEQIDLADEPNIIKLYIKDDEVYKVELNISSYTKYKETSDQTTYTLEYSEFNTVEELTQE